ncbi:hypothetical protein HanXRQr2_Chr07g0297521 [Helianthus annuus]|uniref:Uncharacterized protein n=1 Tax=Helianthus annuus TaxID=4232 RepID=A0A9K3NFW6_HELAN|nr:hypothetical protein HanXRQr2_Chr07g0297521 [Helianthus annuus]KAJ0904929.1 hypothetical protein HanPSC8_Chr07g0288041 [Helianthus annuus]
MLSLSKLLFGLNYEMEYFGFKNVYFILNSYINETGVTSSNSCADHVTIEDWTCEDDEPSFDASFNFSKDNFSMFLIMRLALDNARKNLSTCVIYMRF